MRSNNNAWMLGLAVLLPLGGCDVPGRDGGRDPGGVATLSLGGSSGGLGMEDGDEGDDVQDGDAGDGEDDATGGASESGAVDGPDDGGSETGAVGECTEQVMDLARPMDPVVITADLAGLEAFAGLDPTHLVAFRYDGGWVPAPIQVDERDVISFSEVYAVPSPVDFSRLDYTDAGTFTGPDSVVGIDGDDEIVFMAADAGDRPCGDLAEPDGVVPGSGVTLELSDPLDGSRAWITLFRSDGTLDQAAGTHYVDYDFSLLSGDYLGTYDTLDGPNPEDSWISTDSYARHFADRWITDELRIAEGGATEQDILDRHKSLFGPGVCNRSEDSFSAQEGAFVVNRAGPVRVLRSYVGANSGPLTQRTHAFYRQREDVVTDLRVHPIPGIMDFYDYGSGAIGMSYTNDDGLTQTLGSSAGMLAGALPSWELVSGAQGSLTQIHIIDSTIAVEAIAQLWFFDDTTPGGGAQTQCTGDGQAIGQSGIWLMGDLPSTDPLDAGHEQLQTTRTLYYEGPGQDAAGATQRDAWARNPLSASVISP